MNSLSVLWLLSIKIFITNYTAPDRYQQRKEGAKSALTTLFPDERFIIQIVHL